MLTVEPAERPSVVDLLQENKLRNTQTVKEEEEYERMKTQLSDKEHQLSQVKSQLSVKTKEIERLTTKLVSQEDEVVKQKSACLKLEAELSAVRSELSGLKNSINSSPPDCNKNDELTELKSELAKKQKVIAHQKAENSTSSKKITEMQQQLDLNDVEFEKLESNYAAEMAQMREQLSARDRTIAKQKLENDKMVKEIAKLTSSLKDRRDRRTPSPLKSSTEADAVKRNAPDTIKVQIVPSKGDITALALLDNRLFAAHKVTGQRIDVYDASNLSSKPRMILLERLGDVVYGLAASAANNSLYVSDFYRRKIHRLQLSIVDGDGNDVVVETSTRWTVDGVPIGLSLTSDLRLIVSCQSDIRTRTSADCTINMLIEFSAEGQRLRMVRLHDSIRTLHHAIQLTSGHFVVSHGVENDNERRVCVVDVDGHIVCKSSSSQLHNPRQLAVLEPDHVYVADCSANRIDVLCSVSLGEISSVSEDVGGNSFNRPFALCLDSKLNTLFVTGSATLSASEVKTREVANVAVA